MTTTTTQLGWTDQYRNLQNTARIIMGQLDEMLDTHHEFAEADVNGLGQINYGHVADLRAVVELLDRAVDDVTDCVNVMNGGC